VKLFLIAIWLVLISGGSTACGGTPPVSKPAQAGKSGDAIVTDYSSLVANLRASGVPVEADGEEVDQPFLSVPGRIIKVHGEHVQVFQYSSATETDAQAALVSPDGRTVGTAKPFWIGPPHFFKKGKLLVLYLGDNGKVLKALETVLGPQFAGK